MKEKIPSVTDIRKKSIITMKEASAKQKIIKDCMKIRPDILEFISSQDDYDEFYKQFKEYVIATIPKKHTWDCWQDCLFEYKNVLDNDKYNIIPKKKQYHGVFQ